MRCTLLLLALLSTASPALAFCVVHIHAHVFADANGNGVADPGEAGVAGVTVQFDQLAAPIVSSTLVTDANGDATLPTVNAVPYRVRIVPPAGDVQTTPDPPDGNIAPICFGTSDVSFGVIPAAPALSPVLLALLGLALVGVALAKA
jgi:SdrD B-like domain